MNQEIQIALADLSLENIKRLKTLLNKITNYKIIFEVLNGKDLFDKLLTHKVDIMLINSQMLLFNDYRMLDHFKLSFPYSRIILTSIYASPNALWKYMTIGINGVIDSDFKVEQLKETIDAVYEKGYHCTAEMLNFISNHKPSDTKHTVTAKLSNQEVRILRLVCQEKSSKEIAKILFLSRRTVDGYRLNMMRKIGANTNIGLVKYAIANGFIRMNNSKLDS